MEIANGSGNHMKKMKENNKARIKKWFADHPGSTKKECCDSLKLSYPTVFNLLKDILNEEKPKGK